MDAFEDVDPQHPLGGPDGGKDILCSKDENTFVAAVHFARETISFTALKDKYTSDLKASVKHKRNGFIFLTNQHLTVGERAILEKIAASEGKRCLIYHRERLRVMLDSPQGYGLRLGHLRVPMSNEEQAAFFATSGQSFTDAIKSQARAIDGLSRRIDRFGRQSLNFVASTMAVVADAVREERTHVVAMLEAAAAKSFERVVEDPKRAVSAQLSAPLLRYIHRLILPTDPAFAGKFRETQVWLMGPSGQPTSSGECPAWDKVPILIEELLEDWAGRYESLVNDRQKGISAIARFFQQLVWIHPFVDGNGRLAQAVLSLQARELFGLKEDLILDRGARFYSALQKADVGDFKELERLIADAVSHAS